MQNTGDKPENAVSVPVRIIHVIVISGRDYAKICPMSGSKKNNIIRAAVMI